jgi:hypothetical protein
MSSISIWSFDYSEFFIDWTNHCLKFFRFIISLLSHQSSNQYDIEDVFYHQFSCVSKVERDSEEARRLRRMNHDRQDDDQTWWCWAICEFDQKRVSRINWTRSFYLFHDQNRCDQFDWFVSRRATWSRDFSRRL